MSINQNIFTSNSLVGSLSVLNGYANLSLGTRPLLLEGDQSFVIRLRRNSSEGDIVISTPPITLKDNSNILSIISDTNSASEGESITFTVNTANVPDNTQLFYSTLSVTGTVNAEDFVGGNTGTFTIVNNTGNVQLDLASDSIFTEGTETFRLQIRRDSVLGNIISVSSNVSIINSNAFIQATGGIVTNILDPISNLTYTVHRFNTSGTFNVTGVGFLESNIEYLIVGGGGGAGSGGGGAGGFRTGVVAVTAVPYTITVGGGGASASSSIPTSNGSNSSIIGTPITIISQGGGRGGLNGPTVQNGVPGGSGGGGAGSGFSGRSGGVGNTPPVSPPQGNPGGVGGSAFPALAGAGGGGAGNFGLPGGFNSGIGHGGNAGISSITGSNVYYSGGGGGSSYTPGTAGLGGNTTVTANKGGAGDGAVGPANGSPGLVNTGGGGGGATNDGIGGSGGSGIVILRYRS